VTQLDPDPLDVTESLAPEGMILHGPPRSRLGRLANRLRQLLGRPERDELYGYWGVDPADGDDQTIRVSWTVAGELRVDDDEGEP
jgi:hypothetical protein